MIDQIKRSYLNASETYTLASRCRAVISSDMASELGLTDAVSTLDATMAVLNKSLGNTLKSSYTEQIKDLDAVCDRSVMLLTGITQGFTYSHDAKVATAANSVYGIIRKHIPAIHKLGYVTQMARMKSLYAELVAEANKANVAILGLSDHLEHMNVSRDAFEKAYVNKNQTEAEAGDMVTTKVATVQTQTALEAVLSLLNANLLLNGGITVEKLSDELNKIIDSVHKAAK